MLNPLCQKSETKESQRQIWKVGKSQVRSLNVKYTLLSTRDTTEPLTDITLPSLSSTGLAKSSLQCSSQCWLPSGDSCTLAPQDTRGGIWVRERAGDTITQQNFPLSSCLWPGSQTQNAMLNDALSPKKKNEYRGQRREEALFVLFNMIKPFLCVCDSKVISCYTVPDVLFSWGCLNVMAPRPVDSSSPLSALMEGLPPKERSWGCAVWEMRHYLSEYGWEERRKRGLGCLNVPDCNAPTWLARKSSRGKISKITTYAWFSA